MNYGAVTPKHRKDMAATVIFINNKNRLVNYDASQTWMTVMAFGSHDPSLRPLRLPYLCPKWELRNAILRAKSPSRSPLKMPSFFDVHGAFMGLG